jgi:hypothetical protein
MRRNEPSLIQNFEFPSLVILFFPLSYTHASIYLA